MIFRLYYSLIMYDLASNSYFFLRIVCFRDLASNNIFLRIVCFRAAARQFCWIFWQYHVVSMPLAPFPYWLAKRTTRISRLLYSDYVTCSNWLLILCLLYGIDCIVIYRYTRLLLQWRAAWQFAVSLRPSCSSGVQFCLALHAAAAAAAATLQTHSNR